MSEQGIVDADLGRRERKKLETREALFRAAVQLFSTRGVDETTVEDIADAVDVSARTFHRYFPSKEDVLFFDSAARRRRFADALRGAPRRTRHCSTRCASPPTTSSMRSSATRTTIAAGCC